MVMSICDENAIRYKNEKMAEQFEKHFKKILGTKDEVYAFLSECIMFNNKLNFDEAMRMVRPVTDEEIKDAMFDIDDSKVPDLDGFTAKLLRLLGRSLGKIYRIKARRPYLSLPIHHDKENYLEHLIPAAPVAQPRQQVPSEAFAAHAAWVKGQKEVVVLMLLTVDLEIQRNLAHLRAYDMLQELKALYSKQAKQELLQTVREFHTCKQEEGQSVSLHVLKMEGYINNLKRLGQPVGQNLAVSLILVSLNKDFDSFVQNYNRHNMGKTVNELHAMLKLHEETLPKKDANPALHAIQAGRVQKNQKNKPHKAARGVMVKVKARWAMHLIMHHLLLNLRLLYHPRKITLELALQGLRGSKKLKPCALSLSMYAITNKRAKINLDSSFLWHCRLGHISKKCFEKLQHDGLLNSIDIELLGKCVSCLSGKMARKPYSYKVERDKGLLGLIHIDEVENQLEKTIKLLHSDRGGEYMSQEFLDYLKEHGIIAHRTPPYTHQNNGVLERRNRTLLDIVRSMMSQTTLPKSFWDYALEIAARIFNMVLTKKVEKTPYEVWHGQAPKLSYLKVWGYTSLNHEEDDQEIDEPQSDINPIRRSIRTRRPTDQLCLYIDAEEHELGDLGEPANYKAALLDPESKKWLDAMNVEMQSMKDNDVWVLVELPPNAKTVGSKWLFKKKADTDGAIYVFKARMVAKGFTQTYMVDYEETFSPVADIRAIRILIAIAAYYDYKIWQMNVKTAFLNGHLFEEVYMEQPEGFVNQKYPNHVCKLKRSIYELKQASRKWTKQFDDEIKKFGFTQNSNEPCVYLKASGSYIAILILYVDDILLMGNNIPMLQDVKSYLGRSFAMKDLGDVAYILGIKIYRDRSKRLIGLCQSAYIEKILKRYYMENSKRRMIPMQEMLKLSKSQGNIERELKVSCYIDAVYLTDADNLKSQTGYVFVLNGGVVDWKSTKQSIFATSSTDAEYIAAFDALKEAVWIRKFISGLGIVPTIKEPISMYCDNTRAIATGKDDGVTKALRQIQIPQLDEEISDKALWVTKTGQMTEYSTKSVWRDMECDNPKVIWRHLIWFAQCIPRHSFVLWMAIQNRLMTQDRVAVWKPNEPMKCVLCDQFPDSHDHLFFACSYSSLVWNEMLKTLSKRIISDWNNTVEGISKMKANNSIDSIVSRLVFGVVVYFIWQERNTRMYKQIKRNEESLVQTIKETVRLRMMSFIVKESKAVRRMEEIWNVKVAKVSKVVDIGAKKEWGLSLKAKVRVLHTAQLDVT
nr:retrovirus-related Pol polyprotein from transposon TNT 1-94 [Tanacetum cinerariifolium]